MNQIYNFEVKNPPVLNEAILQNELDQRKKKLQTLTLILAGICIQFVVAMFGFMAADFYPVITVLCAIYVLLSVTGSGIMAGIYVKREESAVYVNN